MSHKIDVLDKGYVRLVDSMGTDLTPVNAARCSFAKESKEMTEKDEKLLHYLAEHNHQSPFRHAFLQFEVKAPLMVCNQWFRYVVGAASTDPFFCWNEMSRRYVTAEPEFYIPSEWRSAPENKKQGSGEVMTDTELSHDMTMDLVFLIDRAMTDYELALKQGVCAEQARLFLPAYAMYTSWYWSCSLAACCHFLNQRLHHDAQREIQEFAKAVYELTKSKFPLSVKELVRGV